LTSSHTVFRLPRSHWHCTIANFEWAPLRPASLQQHYTKFLQDAAAGTTPRHLILTGGPGIGKTHLGVAAYRHMVQHVGTEQATWLNVPAFCDRVKASYNTPHDPMQEYQAARRFVVLDDLFGRELTVHEANQIVYRLLDMSYLNEASLLVTMNPTAKEVTSRLPAHEISRLFAGATIIPVQAEQDWRRK